MDNNVLLKKYIDQEANNQFLYSANYLMSSPRPGHEEAWKEAKERLEGLERIQMMLDIQAVQETNIEAALVLDQQERQIKKAFQTIRSEIDLFFIQYEASCGNPREA